MIPSLGSGRLLEFREAIRLVDKENNKYFYFQFVYCSTRLYIRYDLCINTGPADRMIPYRIEPVLTSNLISSRPSPLVNSRVCAPLYLIQRTCQRYSNNMNQTRQEFRDRQQSNGLEPLSQTAEVSARSIAQRKRRGHEAALHMSIAQC